jgi:hypothetical protein
MPSYYDKDTAVSILFRVIFNGIVSELHEYMKMAEGKKAMSIVGKIDVVSPRLRCTARLKSGHAMWINIGVRLMIVICILRLERMTDVSLEYSMMVICSCIYFLLDTSFAVTNRGYVRIRKSISILPGN